MLLLDTCVLIWLDTDPAKLSPGARQAIRDQAGSLFASSVSAWEVAVKYRKGKLGLPTAPASWFPAVLGAHGINELPLDSQVAIRSTELPPLHTDPFDRIIVATADVHGCPVCTPDAEIRRYAVATAW